MLLNSPALDRHDLSSLRVLFTGGEMVPYERAREFETRTGATVLQFYGSNETGALSATTMFDTARATATHRGPCDSRDAGPPARPRHRRRHHASGGPGVPAGKGPTLCLGYWDDDAANERLWTADGWMRMGDLATIDADGFLTVVGRTSDFIVRGGKNVSAAQVEDEVATHPAVALCAAVAMPDETFGERVCVFAQLRARLRRAHAGRADRAPRGPRRRQGAVARTPRGARRAAALVAAASSPRPPSPRWPAPSHQARLQLLHEMAKFGGLYDRQPRHQMATFGGLYDRQPRHQMESFATL